MKYNQLGRTDIKVSEICLGTMTWGEQNTESEGHEQMDYAVSEGVNFFDTAELYPVVPIRAETHGDTERVIGNWFKKRGKRDDIILASKVGGPGQEHLINGTGFSREGIKKACEQSLLRLKTDYIDLYQVHWPNRGSYHFRQSWGFSPDQENSQQCKDDIAMILGALGELVDEGKIRQVGLSNESTWGTAQYIRLSEEQNLPRVVTVQNEYNLMNRIYDLDMAELSAHEDVGCMCFSPLAASMLSGKYQNGALPEGSRRTVQEDLCGRYIPRAMPALQAYLDIAQRHGLNAAQMSIAFCISRPFMTSTIIGATNMEQLKCDIAAKDVTLSDAVMQDIFDTYQKWPIPM
ncbi:aldo/keto reductase [Ahrensia kielensis]|uniref:Aldo/keto reductase n=1 Tax=Ahrensia kielensis TaxID=76980 RepID=A0ABU9T6W5_9HYPH